MDITYYGHSSFRLRGRAASVITDPFDSATVGLKFPKNAEADIVTVSHDHKDHNAVKNISGSPYVVCGPGEYEVKDISVIGVATYHDGENGAARGKNTAYRIAIDGVSVGHLGDLGHALTAPQLDVLDGIDILLVPVGGFYTIDAKAAAETVASIEPGIVIPMHYRREGLTPSLADKLAPVEEFIKALNKEAVPPVPKLSVTKDKLPAEMQVVLMG